MLNRDEALGWFLPWIWASGASPPKTLPAPRKPPLPTAGGATRCRPRVPPALALSCPCQLHAVALSLDKAASARGARSAALEP